MLKNILNLEGAQKLSKNEQKSVSGGGAGGTIGCSGQTQCEVDCPEGGYCGPVWSNTTGGSWSCEYVCFYDGGNEN